MIAPASFFPGFRPVAASPRSVEPMAGCCSEPTIQDLQPADVLITLAHPDDETFLSGTAALLEQSGYSVQFVYVTDGDAGRDVSGRGLRGKALARVRRQETRDALKALGIQRPPLFLAFADGQVPEQADAIGMALEEVVQHTRPRLILTFGPDGVTQHPDHIRVGAITDAVARASEKAGVYHMALTSRHAERFRRVFQNGLSTAWSRVQGSQQPIAVSVDIGDTLERKLAAIRTHETQFTPHEAECFKAFYAPYAFEEFTKG